MPNDIKYTNLRQTPAHISANSNWYTTIGTQQMLRSSIHYYKKHTIPSMYKHIQTYSANPLAPHIIPSTELPQTHYEITHSTFIRLPHQSSLIGSLRANRLRHEPFEQTPVPRHHSFTSSYHFPRSTDSRSCNIAHTRHQKYVLISSPVPFQRKYELYSSSLPSSTCKYSANSLADANSST